MDKRFFLFLILALLLVSCNQSQEVFISSTYEIPTKVGNSDQLQTPTQIQTVTPTITITPEPTEGKDSPTENVVITPYPDLPIDNRCRKELSEDRSNEQQEFSGNIYFWNPYPYPYLIYDPNVGITSLRELKPTETDIPGPAQGFAPSFSVSSQKIAYLATNSDGFVELWVADPILCHVERIWEDTDQWLGDASEYRWNNQAYITWGPADNTLIIVSRVNRPHIAVYSFSSDELYTWPGECNQIITDSNSNQWKTVCSFDDDGDFNHAILDVDGSIQKLSSIADDNLISAIDGAFSPDQRQVVFSAQDYSLFIINSNGDSMQLPISWDEELANDLRYNYNQMGFKWSLDSSYVLVFGYESSGKYCPNGVSEVTGENYEQPCWFLLDAQSGEIVWWLEKDLIEQILPWDGLFTHYEAALSPDNKWIALFVMHTPIRSAIIVSVESDRIIEIGNFTAEKIHWGKN
ncbi:MAG: hypothetical protein U9R58_11500 [Chloroflexota bacterium]|nr:hypothetical protein [Chloroflexota bacterium]